MPRQRTWADSFFCNEQALRCFDTYELIWLSEISDSNVRILGQNGSVKANFKLALLTRL